MDPRQELEQLDREWADDVELHRLAASKRKAAVLAGLGMLLGFGLIIFGILFDYFITTATLEYYYGGWVHFLSVLGLVIVVSSIIIMKRSNEPLKKYKAAKLIYNLRRDETLEEVRRQSQRDGR